MSRLEGTEEKQKHSTEEDISDNISNNSGGKDSACCDSHCCFEHINKVPQLFKLSGKFVPRVAGSSSRDVVGLSLKSLEHHDKHIINNTINSNKIDKKKKKKRFLYRTSREGMCGPLPWSILPLFAGVVPMIGLAITYAIAKMSCHVEKWIFPYVSYTGTRFPELMFFGLLMNLEGFFGIVIVFLAWRYYRHLGERGNFNNVTLVVGSVSCLGVVIVGNFPVTYSKIPHYFGAALAFILGTLYTVLTAALSHRTANRSDQKLIHRIKIWRIILAVIMCTGLVSLLAFAGYKSTAGKKKEVKPEDEEELLKPTADGSCPFYPNTTRNIDLFGSLVEWILTIGILICLTLFSYEFKAFNAVKIVLRRKNGQILEQCPTTEATEELDDETASIMDDEDLVTMEEQNISSLESSSSEVQQEESEENACRTCRVASTTTTKLTSLDNRRNELP